MLIAPLAILRLRNEIKGLPWADIRFKTKAQSHPQAWLKKILVVVDTLKRLSEAGVRLPIICIRAILARQHFILLMEHKGPYFFFLLHRRVHPHF